MLARVLNRSKDYALFNSLCDGVWLDRMRGQVTCLLYHRVDSQGSNGFLTRGGSPVIAPEELRRDLGFFVERNARFLTLRDLLDGRFPAAEEIGIAVCFDDCFLDNYTIGLRVLRDLGIKATFLQSTAMVEATDLLWEHKLYWHTRDEPSAQRFQNIAAEVMANDSLAPRLAIPRLVEYLREDIPYGRVDVVLKAADEATKSHREREAAARQAYPAARHVTEAKSQGHDVGSHGHCHFKRANISADEFERDLRSSYAVLSSLLNDKPVSFSYPFDSRFPEDRETCARLFGVVATCDRKRIARDTDLTSLPRFSWPGPARNAFRHRRWLLTGAI